MKIEHEDIAAIIDYENVQQRAEDACGRRLTEAELERFSWLIWQDEDAVSELMSAIQSAVKAAIETQPFEPS